MPAPAPVTPAALEALAREYGTPYQLYCERSIRASARALLGAFKPHFPGFRNYFAVKALPNPAVLRVLVSEGCGLDCSSVAELHLAASLGVRGEDVIFTSNYTSRGDLAAAYDAGAVLNLDDASHVAALVAVRGRVPPLVSFRLNPGVGRTDSESRSNVLGGPDAKFGVPPEAIVGAYVAAAAAGASRFGMHMMTGSCVLNDAYWQEAVGALLRAVAQVHAALPGVPWEFINIGGGLGIPYRPDGVPVDLNALAEALARTVRDGWASTGVPGPPPRVAMENGRFLTGPSGWLVARCEASKDAFGARYFGLDACMAHLMRPGMYGAYHHITVPAREGAGGGAPRAPANVVGTLCENNDWFAKARDLPAGAQVGDLFVIHDTGAHSHSMGFQYNSKTRAPELLLRCPSDNAPPAAGPRTEDARVDLIRTRETYASLFGNTRLPADLAANVPAAYPYSRAGPVPGLFGWLRASSFASGVATGIALDVASKAAVALAILTLCVSVGVASGGSSGARGRVGVSVLREAFGRGGGGAKSSAA